MPNATASPNKSTCQPVELEPRQSVAADPLWLKALRPICLFLSNNILQFPLIFEMQQKALDQPELLRREVLQDIAEVGPEFTVIDYGCGSGTYAGLFDSRNYLGIDCSQAMIDRASNMHPDHTFVRADDIASIRERIGTVSHIFMIGVIHHLSEPALIAILQALPEHQEIKLLSIDTLKCDTFGGRIVQLFERGEFLRDEKDHRRLLARIADQRSYKRVPYGNWFELAVFRGVLKTHIS
jgi:SAM-dependent methyltransferase